jgi:hypothetical protein
MTDAHDVHAPAITIRGKRDGLVGDGDLEDPALVVDPGLGIPDAVPVGIELAVFDQPIELGPERVDLEEVAVAPIVEGVECDGDGVLAPEVSVAQHRLGDDALGLAVVVADAEVEVVEVAEDADLGALADRGALLRLGLDQAIDDRGPLPDGIVEPAIDLGSLVHAHDTQAWRLIGCREEW